MTEIRGTNLASAVVPFTTDDAFPTHFAKYGNGGWQEVETTANRDAITTNRREAGMAVYVRQDSKLYILNADLTTWSVFETGKIDTIKVNGTEQAIVNKTVDIAVPEVINNVTSTSTTDALSANMGKELNDRIDNLEGIGRYLSNWNCATGLPTTNPTTSPYTYKTGDYFLISVIDTASLYPLYDSTATYDTGDRVTYSDAYYICNEDGVTGTWDSSKWTAHTLTNYKPDGSSYTIDVPSLVVESEEVAVGDIYMYDGSVWKLLKNTQKSVTFANLAGSPYDNTNLATALNSKQGTLTAGTNITIDANNTISSTAADNSFRGSWATWSAVPTDASSYPVDIHGSHIPLNGDYMIVQDTSGYTSNIFDKPNRTYYLNKDIGSSWTLTDKTGAITINMPVYTEKAYTIIIPSTYTFITGKYNKSNTTYWINNPGTQFTLPEGTTGLRVAIQKADQTEATVTDWNDLTILLQVEGEGSITYSGTWRFHYNGTWATTGKAGWIPEYNVKEVLPVASPTQAGVAKLYTETGTNTDGSMDQNSITTALNAKQNNLTGSNSIDITNNIISAKINTDTLSVDVDGITTNNVIWRKW